VLTLAALCIQVVGAQEIGYPNLNYLPADRWQIISPTMGVNTQLQAEAVNGAIVLGGNARHEVWRIDDPFAPVHIATLQSDFADGEAEAHDHSQLLRDGRSLLATISGRGVDLWDLTDPTAPLAIAHVTLDGVDYGDNAEAVWGLSWQGDALYVGGTNTGIHVIDTTDLSAPVVVNRVPTSAIGGVSAGVLWAIGTTLVVTPPKDRSGLATLDISDPWDPVPLATLDTPEDSYIGGFYAGYAYLVNPWRSFDVLSDPSQIIPLAEIATPSTEYMAFADGHAFVGALRPNPGIFKWDISDPTTLVEVGKVEGRRDGIDNGAFTDDQFALPVGNLLVMCDDELRHGCVLAVHDVAPDAEPPRLAASVPADGATGLAPTARIGLSFTDIIDLRSATADAVILRPLDGGAPVSVQLGLDQTVLHVWPREPLRDDTAYELLLPAGGLTDLAGNALGADAQLVFTTGDGTPPPPCGIEPLQPAAVGADVAFSAERVDGASYAWTAAGVTSEGQTATVRFPAPGRYDVELRVSRDGLSRACRATQIVHPPMPARPATHAATIALDEARDLAWVVNPDAATVASVRLSDLTRRGEHAVGARPQTVAVDERGQAWIAVQDEDLVVVLDPEGAEVQRIPLPWGSRPYGIAIGDGAVWVTLEGRGALLGLHPDSGAELARFSFGEAGQPGPAVRGLALSPDRGTAWVSRYLSGPDHGEIYAVDLASGAFEVITLAHDETPDDDDAGRGVPNALSHLAITPDGARLLAPAKKDNVRRGVWRDGQPLDPDNTVRAMLSFIDPAARAEDIGARIDLDDHERPFAAAFSPFGDIAFVVSQGTNRVDVVETWSGRVLGGLNTGLAPNGAVVTEAGLLLVQELNGRSLSVFDVSGFLDATDATGWEVAVVPTVAEEPLPADVWLGKVLFMNANSSAMSQDGYMACSTCHPDGGHDGMTWDFTQHGEGLRNTIDLRGRAGTAHGPVHWTANFDEIHDFEGDIRNSQGGSGLLDDEDWAETADALGAPKAGRSEQLDALAAYVATFRDYPRSPWRHDDGSLTAAARRGQLLFQRLDCQTCHSGEHLTDSPEGLRHDVGTLTEPSGARRGEALDGLDTPTLYGLYASAPYLHDGSAATIADTLRVAGHGDAQALSAAELADLEAFLLQLEPGLDGPVAGAEPRACGCATSSPWSATWLAAVVWFTARSRRQLLGQVGRELG
jgi:DNA-binding beta-propeller fold protein YncE